MLLNALERRFEAGMILFLPATMHSNAAGCFGSAWHQAPNSTQEENHPVIMAFWEGSADAAASLCPVFGSDLLKDMAQTEKVDVPQDG